MTSISLSAAFCDLVKNPFPRVDKSKFELKISPIEVDDLTFDQAVENLKRPLEERVISVISADNLQKTDQDTGIFLIDQCILFKSFTPQKVQQEIDFWTNRKKEARLILIVSGILSVCSAAGLLLSTSPIIVTAAVVSFIFFGTFTLLSIPNVALAPRIVSKYQELLQSVPSDPLSHGIAKKRAYIFNAYLEGEEPDSKSISLLSQCVRKSELEPLITAFVTKAHEGKGSSPEEIQRIVKAKLSTLLV